MRWGTPAAKIGACRPPRPAARAARIAAGLAATGFALPGTLTVRIPAAGNPPAAATPTRPAHGPYDQWTRKKDGKTVTRLLTDDQLAAWQPWFDNSGSSARCSPSWKPSARKSPTTTPEGPLTGSAARRVGAARLTCGRHTHRPASAQLTPKREDLSDVPCPGRGRCLSPGP